VRKLFDAGDDDTWIGFGTGAALMCFLLVCLPMFIFCCCISCVKKCCAKCCGDKSKEEGITVNQV